MVAMGDHPRKYPTSRPFTRATLPKPVYKSNPLGPRMVHSQPAPGSKHPPPGYRGQQDKPQGGTPRKRKQPHRSFFSKKPIIWRARTPESKDNPLRFPLLGPSRQEAEKFHEEQERAKLEEQLLGTPRPQRAPQLILEEEPEFHFIRRDSTIPPQQQQTLDSIERVFKANQDAFSVATEDVDTDSGAADHEDHEIEGVRQFGSMIDLSTSTEDVQLRRQPSVTSLPLISHGLPPLPRNCGTKLSIDISVRDDSLRDNTCMPSSYRQGSVLSKPGQGARREKTIVPSRIGYHPRSKSPTFKLLESALISLEEAVQSQLLQFGATFSKEVSQRHLLELCDAFEQSSYLLPLSTKGLKPLTSKRSISTKEGLPKLKYLLESGIYESHFNSRGLLVSSARTRSSASTRRTISIRLPPIHGPLEEADEEEDDKYNGFRYKPFTGRDLSELNEIKHKDDVDHDFCSFKHSLS